MHEAPERAVLLYAEPNTQPMAERIGVAHAAFAHGLTVAEAHAAVRGFAGDDGILCLWGQSARDLLAQEGFAHRGFIDLRALCARALGTSPQGLHRAPEAFGHAFVEEAAAPRADRMLARLAWVHAELLRKLAIDLRPPET